MAGRLLRCSLLLSSSAASEAIAPTSRQASVISEALTYASGALLLMRRFYIDDAVG